RTNGPPHPITAYFRKVFELGETTGLTSVVVRLVRDDGAAVFLNGKELVRDTLPPGPLTFDTPAVETTDEENRFRTFRVPADALVAGRNVLAVEVHQANAMSSDL